jgi:hypothetical protein
MFSIIAKLIGEFISLEEPSDDSDIVIVMVLLANGSNFVEFERRIEPKYPT